MSTREQLLMCLKEQSVVVQGNYEGAITFELNHSFLPEPCEGYILFQKSYPTDLEIHLGHIAEEDDVLLYDIPTVGPFTAGLRYTETEQPKGYKYLGMVWCAPLRHMPSDLDQMKELLGSILEDARMHMVMIHRRVHRVPVH